MVNNIIIICISLVIIFFRKPLTRHAIGVQNKGLGMRFGEKEARVGEIMCVVVGSIAIIGAIVRILGES